MSLTNPPKRGLRGLGNTAQIDGQLRASRKAAQLDPPPVTRRQMARAVAKEVDRVTRTPPGGGTRQ